MDDMRKLNEDQLGFVVNNVKENCPNAFVELN